MDPDPACEICGFSVNLDDPDLQVPPPGWICGECHRAREFDELLWEAEEA